MTSHWIMDYETMISCFVACFQHYKDSDEMKVFVIHELRNDYPELMEFLRNNAKNKEYHISFNGISFDSQITQYLLLTDFTNSETATEIAHQIYLKTQEVIARSNNGEFPQYSERDMAIRQIDIFKLNHWDNPAKMSSLKWIQYSMDWLNVQEMPIHHSTVITEMHEIDTVIQYCINDVKSTAKIYELSKDQIALRLNLTNTYNINLLSASEPRISKELFLYFLSKKTGINKYDLKNFRTHRDVIKFNEIILPYIKFKRPEFNSVLEKFKTVEINPSNTKGGFKHSIEHKGVHTDYGLGGMHGATGPGVYEAKNGMIIMTSDVTSFYPNLAIRNGWAPAHLPKYDFCEQYEWFFEERKKIPKKDARNYVYKIILNSTYGLSNDAKSFLYDPEFTMRITINGQLSLTMLYEMLSTGIPGSIPLMQNTDGLEMMIPAHYKDKYLQICAEWEKITRLQLEHDEYKKMIIADVNNYIAVLKTKECSVEEWKKLKKKSPHYVFTTNNGRCFYNAVKCKGRFEFTDLALHKNKSFLVIPKSVFNYFVHDQLPEHTLNQNRNIFDYCGGIKAKGDFKLYETTYHKGKFYNTEHHKIVRYYVSKKGGQLVKRNVTDGREIRVISGPEKQTVFNEFEKKEWIDYQIDTDYYLNEIYKEIRNITIKKSSITNQISLF